LTKIEIAASLYLTLLLTCVNCELKNLNASCDTRSLKFLEGVLILNAAGKGGSPCGGFSNSLNENSALNNALTPVTSPEPGKFYAKQDITITNPNIDANLCFTKDGSEPSCDESSCRSGEVYQAPFTISSTISIKAISCKSGKPSSGIVTSEYVYVPQYLYVSNATSMDISLLSINKNDGSLQQNGTIATTGIPTGLTLAKNLGFVFVTIAYGDLNQFRIVSNSGLLTTNGTLASGTSATQAIVEPRNRYAYVVNAPENNIARYAINQSNGTLSAMGTIGTALSFYAITTDSEGKFIYASDNVNSMINVYTIDQTNGSFNITFSVATGLTPWHPKIHPNGKFLYVSNVGDQTVSCFQRNEIDGNLHSRVDVMIDVTPAPRGIVFNKSGTYAYIVGNSTNRIYRASVNNNTGVLSVINSYLTSGTGTEKIAVDESGNFLYVIHPNNNNLTAFQINQTDGSLSLIGTYPLGSLPTGIVIAAF